MKKKFSPTHLIVLVLTLSFVAVLTLMWTASTTASEPASVKKPDAGPPPTMVNYQGTIRVDGAIYEGTGYFKFAIMDAASGDGTTNYWAHDGTTSGEPTTYLTRTVTNGLFNILLGDTSITSMTMIISETVFSETNTYLRVWFSDSPSGFQALEPNQQFASVAYALRSQYAEDYTETDPVYSSSPAATINSTMISNWNTAYSWGDHSLAGYDKTDDDWKNQAATDVYVLNRNVGIDVSNPSTLLHIQDNSSSSLPQLLIQRGGVGDAYQEYQLGPAGTSFSTGYDDKDKNYKTTNTNNLTGGAGSTQGDGITMLQAHPSGILDFNNQSRARASLNHIQFIPPGIWTPIEFDDDFTLPGGYDQQGEYTPWTPTPSPAIFVATEEGYYQVHARTAFEFVDPAQLNPMGHVSIAIFVTDASGLSTMYAQGNNLQMILPSLDILPFNNAPNVSDVVYLRPGEVVEIHAWQDLDFVGLVSLYIGPSQTYVSIHKDS